MISSFKDFHDKEYYENLCLTYRGVIHDIGTLISILNMVISSMKKDDLTIENFVENLDIMERNVFNIIRMLNNIKDIDRIESGRFKVHKETFDASDLINNLIKSVAPLAENRGINFMFSTNISDRPIVSDKYMVEAIVLNLISNALKFTEPNTVVKIDLILGGSKLQFSVKDQGKGIRYKDVNKIFDMYETKDKDIRNASQGLGLHVVKEFSRLLKGETIVKSSKKGAEVGVILPYKTEKKPVEVEQEICDKRVYENIQMDIGELMGIKI